MYVVLAEAPTYGYYESRWTNQNKTSFLSGYVVERSLKGCASDRREWVRLPVVSDCVEELSIPGPGAEAFAITSNCPSKWASAVPIVRGMGAWERSWSVWTPSVATSPLFPPICIALFTVRADHS